MTEFTKRGLVVWAVSLAVTVFAIVIFHMAPPLGMFLAFSGGFFFGVAAMYLDPPF